MMKWLNWFRGKSCNSYNAVDNSWFVSFRYETEVYSEWTQGVDEVAKANLDKPLIVRDPSTLSVSVNFDPKLVALLREVKYLEQQNCPDRVIPESAANVFQQNETYRKYLQNLDVTVTLYNQVRETIMDVEYALIEEQLMDIDQQLEKATSQLNWTSEG